MIENLFEVEQTVYFWENNEIKEGFINSIIVKRDGISYTLDVGIEGLFEPANKSLFQDWGHTESESENIASLFNSLMVDFKAFGFKAPFKIFPEEQLYHSRYAAEQRDNQC